jgi:hypothetical protein
MYGDFAGTLSGFAEIFGGVSLDGLVPRPPRAELFFPFGEGTGDSLLGPISGGGERGGLWFRFSSVVPGKFETGGSYLFADFGAGIGSLDFNSHQRNARSEKIEIEKGIPNHARRSAHENQG